jgi:hypothetical protein
MLGLHASHENLETSVRESAPALDSLDSASKSLSSFLGAHTVAYYIR